MVENYHGWKKIYADIMKVYGVGYGAILGRFSGLLNLFFTIATFFLVKQFELSYVELFFIGVGAFILLMLSGYAYLKMGLQKSEFSSNVKEQPEMIKLFNDVREIKIMLEEIKNERHKSDMV